MKKIALLIVSLVIVGCATVREPPPQLSGTFSGIASDGSPVVVNFTQSEQVVTGHGSIGATPIKMSALVAPHGPALILLDDGERMTSDVALAADGDTATISIRGEDVRLTRGGSVPEPAAGGFQGRFRSRGLSDIAVELSHSGRLIAGTGFFEGTPVVVVARTSPGAGRAEGELLFADESRVEISAVLSADGRILTIEGMGGPIELVRR